MTYYLRLLDWNPLPRPTYRPLGPDTPLTAYPSIKQGRAYRLRLAGLPEDEST